MTKTQIDKLGERLRAGPTHEEDLRLLDAYRNSFAAAYDEAVRYIKADFLLEPTGRPAKSTTSIVEKLRREKIRLSQVQDIAGCRIVLPDVNLQDAAVEQLGHVLQSTVIDRRDKPSHGYRAVHVLVVVAGKTIEVQVRTRLQHTWAELSEKFSDMVDPAIKYGGGPPQVRADLDLLSGFIASCEDMQRRLPALLKRGRHLPTAASARDSVRELERIIEANLVRMINSLKEHGPDAVSD